MSATFDFYRNIYYGEVLTEQNFPAFITRANMYLDYITMGKVNKENLPESIVSKVNMAECAIAEKCFQIDETSKAAVENGGEISSESVGSYSRTFRSGYEVSKEAEAEIYSIARKYLAFTGLLFRGVLCTRHT